MTVSQFPSHFCALPSTSRHLAYSAVGDADSACVLLCLPGLLETRATFDALLQAAQGVHGLRVISIDHCGRADSSPLPHDKGYTMQVYLEDLVHFIRHELMPEGKPVPRIEVLGTSMGGILAMYLAHELKSHIRGLFFNDIGLDLPWMSIYGLYDGMKKAGRLPTPEEMAANFNVSIGAVLAVQSPAHFDLPYRKDWKGMKFGHLISGFTGPVRLVHGSNSGVCTPQQVKDLQREFPQVQVLEVAGAAHPVPFSAAVNQFVIESLNLPAAPQVKPALAMTAEPKTTPTPAAIPELEPEQLVMPLEDAVVPELPVMGALASVESVEPQPINVQRPRWWSWLKQQLGATKK